jgi:hypothetical protein
MPEKESSIKNNIGNIDKCGTIYDENLSKNGNFFTRALGYPLVGINWLLYLRKKDGNNADDKNIKKMIRSQKIAKLVAKTGNKFGLVQYGDFLIKWPFKNPNFYTKFEKQGELNNCKGLQLNLKTDRGIYNTYLYYKYIEQKPDLVAFYLNLGTKKNISDCINSLGILYFYGSNVKKDNTKSLQLINYIKNREPFFYFNYGYALLKIYLEDEQNNKIIKQIDSNLNTETKILEEIKKHTTFVKKSKIPFKSDNIQTEYYLLMCYYQYKNAISNEITKSAEYQKCFTEIFKDYKDIYPEGTIIWTKWYQISFSYFLYYGLGTVKEEEKKESKLKAKKILELSENNPLYNQNEKIIVFQNYQNLEETNYEVKIILLKDAIKNLKDTIQKDMAVPTD